MSTLPIDNLELRALEERAQLHQRAEEFKTKLSETRENLSVANQSRQHFGAAAAIVSVIGLLSGYLVGGFFTER